MSFRCYGRYPLDLKLIERIGEYRLYEGFGQASRIIRDKGDVYGPGSRVPAVENHRPDKQSFPVDDPKSLAAFEGQAEEMGDFRGRPVQCELICNNKAHILSFWPSRRSVRTPHESPPLGLY